MNLQVGIGAQSIKTLEACCQAAVAVLEAAFGCAFAMV